LIVPFEALAAVLQLRLLRGERGQIGLFTLRPVLMQGGNGARRTK